MKTKFVRGHCFGCDIGKAIVAWEGVDNAEMVKTLTDYLAQVVVHAAIDGNLSDLQQGVTQHLSRAISAYAMNAASPHAEGNA